MKQVREVFRPRKGWVFAQADYGSLELVTFAQLCYKLFGFSALRDALNDGKDPHVEYGAALARLSIEEAYAFHNAGDKRFKGFRQKAKVVNFGCPGGLGAARLVDYMKGFGILIDEAEAKALIAMWKERWPETKPYFQYINNVVKSDRPLIDLFTGRVRGCVRYTNACNDGFQGLGAACGKEALFFVAKACYVDKNSPLFGCRTVNFVHDELIVEVPDDYYAHDAAKELERLMILGAQKYVTDVRISAPPTLQEFWSKDAEAVHDEKGRMVPWSKQPCGVEACLDKQGKRTPANKRIQGNWLCNKHVKEAA